MLTDLSIAFFVSTVKFEFDRANPRQVYAAIKEFYPIDAPAPAPAG